MEFLSESSYIGTFNIHEVFQHGASKSHPVNNVWPAAILDDKTHVVGLCAALRVNEGHHVLPLHIAQDQLGVILKEVHLKHTHPQKIRYRIFLAKIS